jgi:hypothetical protein
MPRSSTSCVELCIVTPAPCDDGADELVVTALEAVLHEPVQRQRDRVLQLRVGEAQPRAFKPLATAYRSVQVPW